jgi:hypothetical protein
MILAAACDRGVDVRPAPDAAPLAAVTREVAAAGPDAAGVAPSVAGPRAAPSLRVTQARSAIHPTGHFDVATWGGSVNTHTLLDSSGRGAVPVSEARFLWGQGKLYVFFYAGDLDIQVRTVKHDGALWNDDSVTFAFFPPAPPDASATKWMIAATPTGIVSDGVCPQDAVDLSDPRCDLRWESGAIVGTDFDGTLNKIGDFDEEWAVELAVPLESLGVTPASPPPIPLAATIRRCEMAHDGPRACGLWGDATRPGELILEEGWAGARE